MLTTTMSHLLPGLPPLSTVTVVAFGVVAVTAVLYLLSRVPELLLIGAISFIYGVVPLLAMWKHM